MTLKATKLAGVARPYQAKIWRFLLSPEGPSYMLPVPVPMRGSLFRGLFAGGQKTKTD